jgi:hypothetical protein
MGYTHYWSLGKRAKKREINTVIPLLQDVLKRYGDVVDDQTTGNPTPSCVVCLNGKPPEDYETFLVDLTKAKNFFCKTGAHAYDTAVCEMLLILAANISNFYIDSDGFDHRPIGHRPPNTPAIETAWLIAMSRVKEHYGIVCNGGYEDLSNSFRFYFTVNDKPVLWRPAVETQDVVYLLPEPRKIRLKE